MIKKSYIWVAVALALAAWGLALYNAAKRLNLRPLLPRNFQFSTGAFMFDLPLIVLNDSNRVLPVSGYAFDLFVNGSFLAKVYAFNVPQIVPGDNEITGRVVIPVLDLVNLIPELRNGSKSVNIRFQGNVRLLELLTIPVPDFNLSLTIPKLTL